MILTIRDKSIRGYHRSLTRLLRQTKAFHILFNCNYGLVLFLASFIATDYKTLFLVKQ